MDKSSEELSSSCIRLKERSGTTASSLSQLSNSIAREALQRSREQDYTSRRTRKKIVRFACAVVVLIGIPFFFFINAWLSGAHHECDANITRFFAVELCPDFDLGGYGPIFARTSMAVDMLALIVMSIGLALMETLWRPALSKWFLVELRLWCKILYGSLLSREWFYYHMWCQKPNLVRLVVGQARIPLFALGSLVMQHLTCLRVRTVSLAMKGTFHARVLNQIFCVGLVLIALVSAFLLTSPFHKHIEAVIYIRLVLSGMLVLQQVAFSMISVIIVTRPYRLLRRVNLQTFSSTQQEQVSTARRVALNWTLWTSVNFAVKDIIMIYEIALLVPSNLCVLLEHYSYVWTFREVLYALSYIINVAYIVFLSGRMNFRLPTKVRGRSKQVQLIDTGRADVVSITVPLSSSSLTRSLSASLRSGFQLFATSRSLSSSYFKKGASLQPTMLGAVATSSSLTLAVNSNADADDSMLSPDRSMEWNRTLTDLACRAVSLRSLLNFYEKLVGKTSPMPHFSPKMSRTRDVVRGAIIPMSRDTQFGNTAYAVVMDQGERRSPSTMVTHHWDNCFSHLVAAILSDALGESSYESILPYLQKKRAPRNLKKLRHMLDRRGRLDRTYWICAFSVNQHASICGSLPPEPAQGSQEHATWDRSTRDTVSKKRYALCSCAHPKHLNDHYDLCEINKFDDLMSLLSRKVVGFSHVVACDRSFEVMTRAWCVAEIAEMWSLGLSQDLLVHSETALTEHIGELLTVRVEDCKASREEDKQAIIEKISDVAAFNKRLQERFFGQSGLLSRWSDGESDMAFFASVACWTSKESGKCCVVTTRTQEDEHLPQDDEKQEHIRHPGETFSI
eukprot:TRINITY_DN72018_c0_g1_i1.p1 TRINITY_DN72018_c0_g1~~TRINITY_DN72018_c0_g1_i1.p1  ORF type:complete len:849 (-),score=55.58 TRINITY_DN72018_c0_g1_i1:116-2662(-)